MAEGVRQYTATFAVGAKLLGNFKSVMAVAEARMQHLRAAAMNVGSSFKKLTGLVGTFGAAFAGFGFAKMFSSLFEGANEEVIKTERSLKAIQFTLLKNNKIMAAGHGDMAKSLAYAKQQQELITNNNAALAKQGVLSEDIFNSMSAQMAIAGIPPKQIMHSVGAMADLLVATQGVTASEEEATAMARMLSRTIMSGKPLRGLQNLGIFLPKDWGKQFRTYQSRLDDLIKRMAFAKGRNLGEAITPLGRIQKMHNEMERLRKEIGYRMLPLQVRLAEMWLTIFGYIDTKVLPALNRLAAWAQRNELSERLASLAKQFGVLTAAVVALGVVASVNPIVWVATAAAGVYLLVTNWQTAKAAAEAYINAINAAPADKKPWWYEFAAAVVEELKDIGVVLIWLYDAIWKPRLEGVKWAIENLWIKPLKEVHDWLTKIGSAIGGMPFIGGIIRGSVGAGAAAAHAITGSHAAVAPAQHAAGSAGVRQSDVDQAKAIMSGAAGVDIPAPGTTTGYARGGIVRKPTIATLAERMPEAIIPMARTSRALSLLGFAATRLLGTRPLATGTVAAAGASNLTFNANITINGNATEEQQAAMDTRLRDISREFLEQFTRAQRQARRLSYEGGYT